MIIEVDDLIDVPKLQQSWPNFKSVSDTDREKIEIGMEVLIRHNGEYFRIRIEEVNNQILIGKVITTNEHIYLSHPFKYEDFIQFEKKNVIDIYDINRIGVLL